MKIHDRRMRGAAGLVAGLLLPSVSHATDATLNSGDTAWLLTSTALVLFMTLPGLALFYGGLVRSRNVLSILMQCFAITGIVTVLWVLFGYALAFGDGGGMQGWIGGLGKAFLAGVSASSLNGTIPESVFIMFQMTFAIITPALIVGAFAERMRFSAMLWFSGLWLVFVYLPVCHWVWGGGWLQKLGLLDFAGGTVVHVNAGVSALVCALVIGRRRGFPATPMLPHNMTMTVTGAAMLWVGWFGFNAGSAVAANGSAGMAMLVTHIAAASGALSWMVVEWVKYGKPSALGVVTGMVAGLGTITPGSGFVGPMGALVIGLSAGVFCFFATHYMKRALKVDDSLDVFPVHGVGGMFGTIAAGAFAATALGGVGLAEGVNIGGQVATQVVGVLATAVWSGALTFVILKVVGVITPIRVNEEQEQQGLDIVLHEERGYDI
jgi:Amt family ammonium transporter